MPRISSDERLSASGTGGFTLLELLVVLVIMGILISVIPRVVGTGDVMKLRAAADALSADLRILRDDAIRRHAPTALSFDAGKLELWPSGRGVALPSGTSTSFSPEGFSLLPGDTTHLRFLSDGSCTGGLVVLRHGTVTVTLTIRGIDGLVAIRS